MKTLAADTYAAHVSAGADADKALATAQEIGDVGHDVRVLKWMVGALLALTLLQFGVLFQIAFRLP